MRLALPFLLAAAGPALAQGFALTDLREVPVDVSAFAGRTFAVRADEPGRLTLGCLDCAGFEAVDVLMGRDEEGAEAAFRAGALTVEALERDCQAQDPSCRLRSLAAGPAVGWISEWAAPTGPGATVVLLRGGDKLTIRSLADSAETAAANALLLLEQVALPIVGN